MAAQIDAVAERKKLSLASFAQEVFNDYLAFIPTFNSLNGIEFLSDVQESDVTHSNETLTASNQL